MARKKIDEQFAKKAGEYGKMWEVKYNGGDENYAIKKYPSLEQLMAGIEGQFEIMVRNECIDANELQKKSILETHKQAL